MLGTVKICLLKAGFVITRILIINDLKQAEPNRWTLIFHSFKTSFTVVCFAVCRLTIVSKNGFELLVQITHKISFEELFRR